MSDFITLKDLAKELNLDKSNLRKYILNQVIEANLIKVRTIKTRGQETLALTPEDAEIVRQSRKEKGFTPNKIPVIKHENGQGFFYVIQLVPDLDPNRVKLGFTISAESRLQSHRTAAPTAQLVKAWGCKRIWEDAAMASATRKECKLIASEVFVCDDLNKLIERIDNFFEQMPSPDFRIEQFN